MKRRLLLNGSSRIPDLVEFLSFVPVGEPNIQFCNDESERPPIHHFIELVSVGRIYVYVKTNSRGPAVYQPSRFARRIPSIFIRMPWVERRLIALEYGFADQKRDRARLRVRRRVAGDVLAYAGSG